MSNSATAEAIAQALLYEGYSLYPYRATALKNRHRWTLGDLLPREYAEAHDGERWFLHTECLVLGDERTVLSGCVRFLRTEPDGTATEGEVVLAFREGEAPAEPAKLGGSLALPFSNGRIVAVNYPASHPLAVRTELSAQAVAPGVFRITVRVENHTPASPQLTRDEAALRALASAHVALSVARGEFVSLTDPPAELRHLATECRNVGVWPVLVGEPGSREALLASPIILEDYPRIAVQSPGDFFDGTEMDEMLALRIRTLTQDEKHAMTADPRTAAMLDRVEQLPDAKLAALHGINHLGCGLNPGDRVRLCPRGRADAFDILLAGKSATIASVEVDFEGIAYFAVTVDDDPGSDLGQTGQPGHRFFFRVDEVEPLGST